MMRRNAWCYLALAASAAAYAAFAFTFFPDSAGRLGEDYAYFLPLLLAGRYWISANGLFAVPHFSPAFCGGMPLLANPQSIFYSVPQALAQFTDPLTSFFLTCVLFAWIGGVGTFFLLRRRFGTSLPAASLGAVIFLFNGLLLYRMAIGHVTYHTVGLLPLLCFVLLTPIEGPGRLRRGFVAMALGGAMLAYFVYAGAANILVLAAFAVLAVWLLHAIVRRPALSFWPLGLGAGILGAAVAAAKLAPAFVLLTTFSRDDPLRLFSSFTGELNYLFRGLFLPALLPDTVLRQEFEYGLGLPALLLILLGAAAGILGGAVRRRRSLRSCLLATALAALFALPLWLNVGTPDFGAWLKTLPYFRDNEILVRWFLIYMLPVTIAAALALDFVFPDPRVRGAAALIAIAMTVLQSLLADTTHYRSQSYDPAPILAAGRSLRATGAPPPIVAIGQDLNGIAAGHSTFPCYEPLFGYKLQSFPWNIRLGSLSLPGHHLRNPACYIYGRANGCSPGDSFTDGERAAEAAFAAYRPFPYRDPWWQRLADGASLFGLALMLAGFVLGICRLRRHLSWFQQGRPALRTTPR